MKGIINKKIFNCFAFLIISVISLLNCFFLVGCSNNEDVLRRQAIEHENYLLAQMQTIESRYQITDRNIEEIVLQNYYLGSVNVYDKNGIDVGGFLIDNHTVYHNWYTINKNEDGNLHIKLETLERQDDNSFINNEPYIIHDRSLSINLEPYVNFNFASENGNREFRNSSYETENSYKIKHEVKTNVTEFETTRIINIERGAWNSSHTNQFCSFEIQLVKVVFDDTTYNSATIMEYRFTANSFVNEKLETLLDSYND